MAKQRSKSSRAWLKEHFTDPYVIKAQQEGYRSRAVYKLLELQARDKMFKPNMTVIDLGAAPGGWCQIVSRLVKPNGRVIAMDLLTMEDLPGVEFIQGDFSDDLVLEQLLTTLDGTKPDWVISDMAPNMSGTAGIDMPRAYYLYELAFDFALQVLGPKGGFLIKVFQGEGFDAFLLAVKKAFKIVHVRKPQASRERSREIYILAKELRC